MATSKRTHSPKKRSRRFAGVHGKIVERVEIDAEVIGIYFQDKTALTFDVESINIIYPELSDWRTGNSRSIKKWPEIRSKPSMVEWP
jgi:hypothetical protein